MKVYFISEANFIRTVEYSAICQQPQGRQLLSLGIFFFMFSYLILDVATYLIYFLLFKIKMLTLECTSIFFTQEGTDVWKI